MIEVGLSAIQTVWNCMTVPGDDNFGVEPEVVARRAAVGDFSGKITATRSIHRPT